MTSASGATCASSRARAEATASCATGEELAGRGLQIRAGIHVGDVDVRGDDVSGLAVNIAARIMSHAGTGQTLVSDGTRQATLGSSNAFEPFETVELKGIPGNWTLHLAV